MPLPSSFVGTSSEPRVAEVDPRWSMAYAAALDDLAPCYMDTRAARHFLAHPMFPVCIEWPVAVAMGQRLQGKGMTLDEFRRSVHATHDVTIHRPIRPPEKLITHATVVAVERRRPGAYQVTRLETVDESGAPVCTSMYGSIYRGVDVSGDDKPLTTKSDPPHASAVTTQPRAGAKVRVAGGLAHTYTECAQIWNPIHTDIKVARNAGLPALILHGTATLALAVSRIVHSEAGGDPSRIARIAGRFTGMVLMPSDISVRTLSREPFESAELIHFDVLTQSGEPAISNGAVVLRRLTPRRRGAWPSRESQSSDRKQGG
jgi:acyl dehydratase